MANQVVPLFKTNYVDYLGRLRYLEVKSVIGHGGGFYFRCIIDEQDVYDLRLAEDGQWYDLEDGPTVLADEIGSIIESRIV